LHGTGITLVPKTLELFGFTNVHIVQEQATPDGNFPTVVYPNPEEQEAMTLALKKAAEVNADLVLATDPDADRVGIAAKNEKGEFVLLNGNQTATLLCYYMLNAWKETGKITGKEFIVKTIVTTDILDKIAEKYGVKSYTTLTGFKFIGEKIKSLEGKETYIVGGEESYGYLAGDFVRDKDAVSSCALIAEMTAYAKDKGLTLFDLLYEIYATFGYYKERLISLTKKGKAGAEEINEMMEQLRKNPPQTICGEKVTQLLDYQLRQATNLTTQQVTAIELPKSNVIQLITEKGTKVTARPSGTEPKIKFYFSVNAPLSNKQDADKVTQLLDAKIRQIITEMKLA
jgi:phosphoglucomutase